MEKRIPKPGDLIQVVNAQPEAKPYENGDIFEVGYAWDTYDAPGARGGVTTVQNIEMYEEEFVLLNTIAASNPHEEVFAEPMGAEFGSDEYEFLHRIGTYSTTEHSRELVEEFDRLKQMLVDAPATLMTEMPSIKFVGADKVNHPSHYTSGKFETIEVIEEFTQGYQDSYVAYCVGNVIKYLARAPHKHDTPEEDLRKAAKYIEFALARFGSHKP